MSRLVSLFTRSFAGLFAGLFAGSLAAMSLPGLVAVTPADAQDAEGESSPVEVGEPIASDRVVIADGHVDVGPRFVDGSFTLLVRDDTVDPSVWRRLPDVVLHATDASTVQVPDDPTFSFLGPPGAQVWLVPQVQQPGIVWPGWNTQDPEVAANLDREVTWTLTGVDGPGAFLLFVNEDFGQPATIFDSRQPVPQQTGIDLDTHAHANWTFSAPGIYRLGFEMSAVTLDGEAVAATGNLQIAVGDTTDPQAAYVAADTPADDAADEGVDDGVNEGVDDAAPAVPDTEGSREHGGTDAALWLALVAVAVVGAAGAAALIVRARRPTPPGDG